jgi:hypothetical protein
MKKMMIFFCMLFIIPLSVSAEQTRPVTVGIHMTGGLRYDDVRMCVATDAGVKGGAMMDLYFDILIPAGEKGTFLVNIPVMRPILFAAAFEMLQFEPQVSYEYHVGPMDGTSLVLGGGLGLVFHYGPDYKSSADDRGDSFFAMGPLVNAFAGIQIPSKAGNWMPGIKAFYSPLFSPDYNTGQVLGGAAELHYRF